MLDKAHVHRGGIMWRYIVAFINHYQIKWLLTDSFFIADCLGHGLGATEYHKIFSVFGVESSTVDSGIAALGLVRIGILLYQRAVEC